MPRRDDEPAATPRAPRVLPEATTPPAAAPAGAGDDGGGKARELGDGRPSAPPLSEERRELGRYQLLFELARGGMGTVYVGRLRGAHGFDRLVAIKRLHAAGAGEDERAAFQAEARLSAHIEHPNVVQTIELGEHEGAPFIVMELLDGVPLSRLWRRATEAEGALDPHLVAWIGARVADGLHAAHELCDRAGRPYGLVHRDVSPENVLLSFRGRVCVADFGVAKFSRADKQTQSGVVKGKFAYMSPEQSEATALDRRSDIFSLGIVLHECLTGERLFDGASAADTIRRIWQHRPVDPHALRPAVPAALGAIVMRCLEKEPEQRYGTAGALAAALRQFLRDEATPRDEADLCALLDRHFAAERRWLGEKIRRCLLADDGEPSPDRDREPPADAGSGGEGAPRPAQGSVTASIATGPPLLPRRYGALGAALAVALALAAGLLLLRGGPEPSPALLAPRSAGRAASASPAPAALPPTPVAASAPDAAGAPAESAPVSARPFAPRPGPVPTVPKRQAPAATAATPPAPSAPPSSQRGVPFRTLDP